MPARTSAQRRFHTKKHAWCAGYLTMDAPLWGDTGGHIGTAPTHLRYTFTHRGRKCIAHSRPHSFINKKVCVCYDLDVTMDDAICFKTSYSFGVTVDNVIRFKASYFFGVTVASP